MVPDQSVEQTVEFTISLVDPGYRELLDDADSPQYHDLSRHLQEQVRIIPVTRVNGKAKMITDHAPLPILKQPF